MRARTFAKILLAALAFDAAAAGACALRRAARARRLSATGTARWIWPTRELPRPEPLAFAAWKDFRLDANPAAPMEARVFFDRAGTLSANGAFVGRASQKPGDPLAVFDLAPFLRAGDNRVRIEAESPTGAGGVLFFAELPGGRPLVSDASWTVERAPPAGEAPRAAIEWGKPPMSPWGYPALPAP